MASLASSVVRPQYLPASSFMRPWSSTGTVMPMCTLPSASYLRQIS